VSLAEDEALCPLSDDFPADIQLTGLSDELEGNARAILISQLQLVGANLNRVRFEFAVDDGEELIEQSLHPYGYYSPDIRSSWYCDKTLRLSYQVDVGIPIIVNTLNLQILGPGADNPALQSWQANFPLTNGQRLIQPDYDKAKRRAQSLTASLGYFDARFEQARIAIDRQQAVAEIDLELVTGVRYKLSDVTYQQPHMSNELIDRYIRLNPGDNYDINDIAQLQTDLYSSGFFSVVDIQAEPEKATQSVPVSIRMERANRNAFNFGIGYSTDTGTRGSFNWTRRWLNPQGHVAEFDSRLSENERFASLTYRIPGADPARENKYYRVGYVADDEEENYGSAAEPAQLIIDVDILRTDWLG
jgi:translocation and assembly module TamA